MKKLFLIIIGLCLCTALYADMNTYIIGSGAVSGGGGEYILGYNAGDLDTDYGYNATIRGTVFTTDSTGGTLTKFGVTISVYSGAPHGIKLGIYPVSSGDPSGQTLIESVTGTITGTGDLLIDAAGTTSLSGSTAYYVCVIGSDSSDKYTFGTGTTTSWNASVNYADAMPSTFPSATSASSRTWGVWCVYTH